MAWIADRCRNKTTKEREDDKYGHEQQTDARRAIELSNVKTMNAVDFYNKLLPLEAGEKVAKQDEQMTNDMKEFLMMEFGTTKVSQVNKDALKAKLEGPALIERIAHRKAVAMAKQKEVVAKGAVLRRENRSANTLEDHQKNPNFGFSCLHYSVSEAAGAIKIQILNKTGRAGTVSVRTVDGEAVAGEDYGGID